MKKIVINICYGGFDLSHKAVMRYAKLKGIKLYGWVDDNTLEIYGCKNTEEYLKKEKWCHYTTVPKEEYEKLSTKEAEKPVEKGRFDKSAKLYFSVRDIPRDDPILIQVVEELKDKANGSCAKLKIVKVPDDIEYTIEEYDGIKHVAEKHRIWN